MFNGKKTKNYFDLEKNKNNDNKIVNIKNNISSKKNFSKTKEKLIQYPQVINNYDVNVRVNIKKLNDNKINIENLSELINRKLDSNNLKNKKTKFNQLDKIDNKEIFYKTDNNINYLNFTNESKNNKINYIINNISNNLSNINKENEQNGEHYNNMILNLKQEFKQLTKEKDIYFNYNIFNKEKKSENYTKKYLSNTNNNNNLNKNKYINNTYSDNINKKKYSWNLKSINDKNKKYNNDINNIYEEIKEQNKENKIKTQNNFYRKSNRHIGELLNEELSELKLTEKNDEKIKSKDEKIKRNLKKAINFINDKKKASGEKYNNLNLTDNLNNKLNNNLNNNHSSINIKENKNKLNLTSKDNTDILNEYINSSKINCKINNKKINKCNSYIYNKNNLNLNFNFNDTQSFIIEEENNNINKINKSKIRNNMSYINEQNIILNINKQPYLNKKINKIKKKIIDEMKNENINNSNFRNNIYEIVKNISFSLINRNNKKIIDNLEKKSLYIVNKILNAQNNIILELKKKEFILKNELIKKSKEIINLKNICMKLMWYIKFNKDFNFNENNKKKYLIQDQIIKENRLLRKLYLNNKNISNISINEININNPIDKKLKEKRTNNNYYNIINKETMITLENNTNNRFIREKEYFNIYDKKRNKSYERVNEKNKRKNNGIDINIFKNNEMHFNYTDYIQKRNNSIIGRDNNNESARIGKKIKYLVKEKYSY